MPTFKGICIGRFYSLWQLINGTIAAAAIWAMVVTGATTLAAQAPRPFRLARMAPLPLPQHPIARASLNGRGACAAEQGIMVIVIPAITVASQPIIRGGTVLGR